ncbi:MAG: dephospho-CoA kinase [Rikenellaceae bacterium]|nr:dephospho-CoA kinase [Rikenellaceae bacterium]MCL2693165.1 dephospho-CoA kinase [Rikenellaceae bacterium]
MIRVGLTGGIGSGKSTVGRIFETLGAPVYHTDPRARELMVSDPELVRELVAILGGGAYLPDGELDKAYVASRIFADRELLAQVNAAVHPRVARDFERWADSFEKRGDIPYIIMECAILFESGFDELVDYSITVSAPLDERVGRAVQRDAADPDDIRRRMANQMTDAERESRTDFILHNSDHDMVLPGVLELHERFMVIYIENDAENN